MFVKPQPGRLVRDPMTKLPMSAEGRDVSETSYWLRRLRAGDVALATPPAPVPADLPAEENA